MIEVDHVLREYLAALLKACPELVEGVYITGSVALGDYYPRKSDIDFITLLSNAPSAKVLSALGSMHRHLESTLNRPDLSGYYLTLDGLRDDRASFPSFFKNKMLLIRPFELDKFTLFEWKHTAITLFGTPAKDLDLQIGLEDVLEQLHQNINEYWAGWIRKHRRLGIGRILLTLFPRLSEWGLLGVARQLYTLETGQITSKRGAGSYFLERMPDHLKAVMQEAIDTRKVNGTRLALSLTRAGNTIAAMEFIIGEFNGNYR